MKRNTADGLFTMSSILPIESPVDNPESTIESFNRQFQLGKIEKEAVEWAWTLEAGDTIFCSFLSLLKQIIK